MFLAFILSLLAVLIISSYSDGEIYFNTIFPQCPPINKKLLVLCSNGTVGMFEWAESCISMRWVRHSQTGEEGMGEEGTDH